MCRLSSEGSLIPQPLPVLLDASDLLAIVVWHWVLDGLTSWVDTIAFDVLVEVVVLVCDLLGVLAVEQTPDRVSDCGTGKPAKTSTGERQTGVDIDGIETSDGVAWVDFEREEVGSGGGGGEQRGGNGGHHSGETSGFAKLEILVPVEMLNVAAVWGCGGSCGC